MLIPYRVLLFLITVTIFVLLIFAGLDVATWQYWVIAILFVLANVCSEQIGEGKE